MSYAPEVENAASEWLVKHRATDDPRTVALIVRRAQQLVEEFGGYISPSHFERAYLELLNEGEISKLSGSLMERPVAQTPADSPLTADGYNSMSAATARRQYQLDPNFRSQVDRLIAQGKIAMGTMTLTVEQYRSIPARVIAHRYIRDPNFRAAVDLLVAQGRI